MRKPFRILPITVAVLMLSATLAAQSGSDVPQNPPAEPTPCDSLDPAILHVDALKNVCSYAVTVPQRLPNFRCRQETTRTLSGAVPKTDTITGIVSYEDSKESYQEVKRNGQPVQGDAAPEGAWSAGQFGSDLQALFDGSNKVEFDFAGEGKMGGSETWQFSFRVPRQEVALWRLHSQGKTIAPPYYGRLWIAQKDGLILRLLVEANQLPLSFPVANATLEVDYQNVRFADGSHFVLPVESVLNMIPYEGPKARNVQQFKDCKKFTATHRIVVPPQ